MAKSPDQPESTPPATSAPGAQAGQQAARPQVEVDDSRTVAAYANFCRVTGTPEEMILDFGLNPQPFGTPTAPIHITQRIILNFYTAKRMHAALQMALARHEQAFGVLETDVQKRVLPSAMRGANQPTGPTA